MTLCIIEHKSTSEDITVGSDYWKRLRLDPQISNYFVGARSLGFEPEECLYDVVRKPGIRPSNVPLVDGDGVKIVLDANGERVRTKDGKKFRETGDTAQGYVLQTRLETADEYRLRLREDIAMNPARYYARGQIVRLEEDEKDAGFDVWQTAREIREAELTNRWPRNPDACLRYGRTCDFFAVCTREGRLDDATHFRKKEGKHSELEDDGKKHLPLVTTSSMRAFRRCSREYEISYVLGYTSVEQADALRFGTLFHKGLEVWWKTVDLGKAFDAMANAADDYEFAKAQELMRGYHFMWKDEPFEVLAVEAQFSAPLINPATGAASKTYELGGKIDAVARRIAA